MCEECNGHVSQSNCPVCSDDSNVTPFDEITKDDVISVTMLGGIVVEVTAWVDGKECDVAISDLSAELRDRLIEENEEE